MDFEIDFAPSHARNLACALPETHPLFQPLKDFLVALDLKNIRVITKIVRMMQGYANLLEGHDDLITNELLKHTAVLCWSYYLRGKAIPFEFLKSRLEESTWTSFYSLKDKELSEEEVRYPTPGHHVVLGGSQVL